jgi:hypothetical protein
MGGGGGKVLTFCFPPQHKLRWRVQEDINLPHKNLPFCFRLVGTFSVLYNIFKYAYVPLMDILIKKVCEIMALNYQV